MRILALDVGTSRTKVGVYDGELRRYQLASRVSRAVGGDGTVDLPLLVADVAALLRETGPYRGADGIGIEAIGVTTIYGHVFLDATGEAVTAGWGWSHAVAREEAAEIDAFCRERQLDVGRPVTPELLAPRLVWLRRYDPDLFQRITQVFGIKDYLLRELTGATVTDPSQRDYAVLLPEVVAAFLGSDGPREYLPGVAPAHAPAGTVQPVAAEVFGVPVGTPVAVGSSDGTAAMYGAGVLAPGVVAAVSGSTDVCMVLEDTAELGGKSLPVNAAVRADEARADEARAAVVPADEARHLIRNSGMISGTHLRGGSTGASGEALRWWRGVAGADASPPGEWRTIPPGSEGVRVSPGFAGERAPFFRGTAGTIDGLTLGHGMAHIVRALHEANAYRLARLAELIVASSPSANRMILGGGAGIEGDTAAIDAIRAAVAPLPLSRADDEHLSMRGAAMFALVAASGPADRTHADRRLRQLSEMVAARATPVAGEAHLRKTYGALYRRWLAWMETVLPPMETPGGSTLEDGDGGSRG